MTMNSFKILKSTIKSEKAIILFFIVGAILAFSLTNFFYLGDGVKFVVAPDRWNPGEEMIDPDVVHEIKVGETKTINLLFRNYTQERVLVAIEAEFDNFLDGKYLEMKSQQYPSMNLSAGEMITLDAPILYYQKSGVPLTITAIKYDESNSIHKINLTLSTNYHYTLKDTDTPTEEIRHLTTNRVMDNLTLKIKIIN